MTTQKQSSLQTALMTICTTAAIGSFVFLWNINAFMSKQEEINIQLKETNKTQILKTDLLQTEIDNHNTRLFILEQKK